MSALSISPELIRKAQAGDEIAFTEIHNKIQPFVFKNCYKWLHGNQEDAEDLTQQTMLHIFKKLKNFKFQSALSTWVYRVAFNMFLMSKRTKRPPVLSLNELQEPAYPEGKFDKAPFLPLTREDKLIFRDGRLESTIDRIALTRAIAKLPPGYRRHFLLAHVAGLEHKEVAKITGKSVGSSKSQTSKARTSLKEQLQTRYPPRKGPVRSTV